MDNSTSNEKVPAAAGSKVSRKKNTIITAFAIIAVLIMAAFPFISNYRENRRLEKIYDDKYPEVSDYIEKERLAYRNAKKAEEDKKKNYDPDDGEDTGEVVIRQFLDIFTLGAASRSDPRNYDNEDEYVLEQVKMKYSRFGRPEPEPIIAEEIINGGNKKDTLRKIKDDEEDSQWFDFSLSELSGLLILPGIILLVIVLIVVVTRKRIKENRENSDKDEKTLDKP